MNIDYNLIKKIFNNKIKIKDTKTIKKISNYDEFIPMYDIYSDKIYPINKINLHYRLIDCHYRFITNEIKEWIKNKYSKYKNPSHKKILNILENYDLDILEKTSYETLYKYSPQLGLSISICKRNSFYPLTHHLEPYYNKNELIKLGLNNKIITESQNLNLSDKKLHYKICKIVSKNDISIDLIHDSMKIIIDNKLISWICFYSLTGSYLFNNYLRTSEKLLSKHIVDGLSKLNNLYDSNKKLDKDYILYRFIVDDKFIKNLKIGENYLEKGFLSTTRDPFYSPGLKLDFGLILIKINIPVKLSNNGFLIENFSLFPKEQEYLLSPNCKLKLISKDNNFKYYHTNKNFEKLIKTKYEFNLIESLPLSKIMINQSFIPNLNLDTIEIDGRDRVSLFEQFLQMCDENYQFSFNNRIFNCEWFDSTSVYNNFYYNKTKDGLLICNFINGYPVLCIECGNELIINYIKKNYYYDNFNSLHIDELNKIVSLIAKVFKYSECKIYFDYKNFTEFKINYSNEDDEKKLYLYNNLYCENIYLYLKNKTKKYNSKFYKYNYGYWNLDKLSQTKLPNNILNKLPDNFKVNNWKDLIIQTIEKKFYNYKNVEKWCNYHHDNIFKKNYVTFDCNLYLKNNGYDVEDMININFDNTSKRNNYNLIYRLNTRRV